MFEFSKILPWSLALFFKFTGMFVWQVAEARTITSLTLSQGSIMPTGNQAIGSDIMAILVVNPPPASVPWEIDWTLHDTRKLHILGTISLSASLTTTFEPFMGGPYENRVTVGITPSVLSSANDEIRSVVTLHELHPSETGFQLGIVGRTYSRQFAGVLNVTECSSTEGRIKVLRLDGICGYNCQAQYECEEGFVPVNSYVAECMANARWNLTDESCVENKLEYWELSPPSKRSIYAVGFTDLMIHVKVDIADINHCAWLYDDGEWSNANFFDRRVCSEEFLVGTKESISCYTDNGFLFSNLTFKEPLPFGKLSMSFSCHSAVYLEKEISILYCPPGQGSVVVTHRARHCGYNCPGTYSCLDGLIPLNRKPVVCTVTADWNVTAGNCVPDLLRHWETFPQNARVYAVGFEGLIVNINIDIKSLGSCVWKYGGELDDMNLMRTGGGLCRKRIVAGVNETITCHNERGTISSNLTFHEPLTSGTLHIILLCDSIPYLDQFIAVRYCSTRQDYAVINFASVKCGYRCLGFYDCPSGFERFGIDRVICTAIAQWNITRADCILTDTEIFADNFNMTDNSGPEHMLVRHGAKKYVTILFGMYATLFLLDAAVS